MPSPRTDGRFDIARGVGAFFQKLNTRLVLAIASVALVGLLVSAVAINQILPGYFAEQTTERLETAAGATGLLMQQLAAREIANNRPGLVETPELRARNVVAPAVQAAQVILPATYAAYDAEGDLVATSEPGDVASLRDRGLTVDPVELFETNVTIALPSGDLAIYELHVSEPYTSREATVAQIQSAIVGSGILALAAALILGILAARRVTAPIYRLRRVAGHVAQGELDERASQSGVLEVDELAQQFNVMADRLAGTLRMLEADRDRLREFVADVSHELRTPIAALRMYTELQREDKVDEATRREFLERSTDQIARLEWLSTNLLDLSRIDAGIFPLDMRTGDLRDPIQAVVQALSEVAVARGIRLESFVPGEQVEVRFDRERIVQLLTNLVGNAVKFTPRGGSVSVRLLETDGAAEIEVRDTGTGIPADELPRIFERFYRGTNTGEARASGSGLGLAIVRSIVEMHGGEVDVASVLGEGTVFHIRLPRTAPLPEAPEEKVNETSRSTNPARNPGPIA